MKVRALDLKKIIPLALLLLASGLLLFASTPAKAATGINQQLNFQGRLLNSQGAIVPDGNYNIEFKIYSGGDGQEAGDTGGTLEWTEDYLNNNSQGVQVKNGFLSVQLGSICSFSGGTCQGNTNTGVNWNSDTLWLSMNIAGTGTTCTPFASCSPDGEMVPMKRLSANAYSLNSGLLDGLSSASFGQLTTNQTFSGNNTFTGGFSIQSAGGTPLLNANVSTGEIQVGSSTASTNSSLLILNSYSGASDPAIGVNGAMYYNTSMNAFRCYTNGAWANCSGATGSFVQLAPSSAQIDSSTNSSIFLNKTGASGDLVELQSNGQDSFIISNTGNVTLGNNANHSLAVVTAAAGNNGNALTVSAGNGGTSASSALAGGALALQAGNGGGLNGNGGNVSIDAGAKNGSGTDGTVNIGTNHASAINIGTSGVTTNNNGNLSLGGSLVLKNGSSAVTLNNAAGTSGNYSLAFPTSAPATGLCLETSPGDANQLVFASCTNNNASIQEVTEWDANNTNTLTISPSTVGDEVVLATQIPTSGVTVTGVSGGGVTTWNKVVVSAGNGTVNRVEMWVGTVVSAGSSTITVTYSSSPGAEEITATEFTAAGVNASTSWGIESSASQLNSTASATVTYPSRTAVNGSELYVGYAQVQNPPATSGGTPAFNYIITSTQHNVITYDTDLAANTSYQPTANQNSAGESNTVAVVLTAFVTSTSINNTTSLQQANFYIQAATNGSVAGVLQAASSGTADILDLRNSGGVNVLAVGSAGNLTLSPSASTTALQVQNTSGNGILTVDTQNNRVVLGSPGSIAGKLTFSDSSDSNTISLTAPTSIAASYTLALPTNTPTGGLCLGTDPSNASQLIFASCATQVSAASISYVNTWSNSGTSVTTVADSPTNKGDLLVLFSHATNNVAITGVSGGGVTNWTKVTSNTNTTGQGNNEMWRGVVTSTGSATITVTYSSAAGGNEIVAQEFTMGSSSGTWAIDTSGTTINSGSQTTINYPSLTPANSSELYAGYAWSQYTMSSGTTAGFTYVPTNGSKYTAYDTNITGGSAVQPTASQSTAGNYNSIAAVIAAYAGTSVIVNSTATQQANFSVQAALSGTVAGVVQGASSGTADIFDAKDGNGNNIMSVNGSLINSLTGVVNGVTLGTPGTVAGQLNFAAGSNSNSISIVAPSNPGASYYLTLPTTTPAPGQCLASSPNNANQLVFSSCANQVTSIAISFVNNWKVSTSGLTPSLSVTPTRIGDLMTFFVYASKGNTVTTAPSGCGITWSQIVSANSEYMYRGIVTSTASCSISLGLSTPSAPIDELAAQEWTTGSANGSWVIDASGTINNASSTTVTYPSLTPQSTKDLYVGYAIGTSTMSAGSTSGYTYFSGAGADMYGAYNTSVSAATQPTASQSGTSTSIAAGALIAAYSSSSVISNSTVTQEANFNIQAATNGSVAGVLQAASGGTGDVLDILDASNNLTDSFGSTGNLLVRPSTASATAFQVQNVSSVNVLSVDTNNKLVVIGAGSTGEASPSLLVIDSETGTTADPSVLNGAMYYNATTHTFRCGVDGAWQNCNSLLFANTSASASNSNCSNNCVAFTTTTAIPANYCQPGRVIKLYASGYFSSQATASNLQFGVYYGTDGTTAANDTLLGTLTSAATVTSASNNYFQMNFNITCFSTTTMQTGGALNIQTGTSSAGLLTLPMGSNSGTTVVSSSTKNLYIFPVWDTASLSNTAKVSQFTVNAY